jgi:hypothetical protein
MNWCAIILACLLSEGIEPGTQSTGAGEPDRLSAIAKRLSEAPDELNRKMGSEDREMVGDVISLAAIAKQAPELGQKAAGVLANVLQRETKRDSSLDLKPWERVQLAAALVLVKIEGKNAAGRLQGLYERSRSPVVWAQLEQQLAALGISDANSHLKPEERVRREKLVVTATATAQKRIGRAIATIKSLIKGEEVVVMPEEEKEPFWHGSGYGEMQWLVRDLGALSAFVTKKQRDELAEQFVGLLFVDNKPPWLRTWIVGVMSQESALQATILDEMRNMPGDCPAFERLLKFLPGEPHEFLKRQAALVLDRWRISSEIVGKETPRPPVPGRLATPNQNSCQ